ncbi:MAG: NADPH:quinone reductase [Acidiferrobacterales bacterium]
MRAAWFETCGSAAEVLKVGEQETPEPAHGEVRVRLYASGVNPSDVKKRAGLQPAPIDQGPVIPHSDGAGVIDAVGSGVPKSRIGERVWVYQAQYQRRCGTAAEYITLPVARVVHLPDEADFHVGACMGIPAMTAHRCVFADEAVAEQTLLITGAAGRVGYYAVQWAKWGGGRVIGTIGSEKRMRDARDAGADMVVNYREDDVVAAVNDFTKGAGVDRVIDVEFGVNLDTTLKVIRTGGVIATYSSTQVPEPKIPFYPMMFKCITVRFVLVYAMSEKAKEQAGADIMKYLQQAKLKHRIADAYPLHDIAKAHEAIERGSVPGCILVEIP